MFTMCTRNRHNVVNKSYHMIKVIDFIETTETLRTMAELLLKAENQNNNSGSDHAISLLIKIVIGN